MKKTILYLAAITIAASALASCDKKEENTGKKLTYWCDLPAAATSHIQSMGEMLMYKELEKRTGVEVEFIHPPAGQSGEQFNLLIASGVDELPDIMEYNWVGYSGGPSKAISDGILLKLNDLIESHAPNFAKAVNENELYKKQSTTDNGEFYGFPALNVGSYRTFGGLMIRKDWLDDLGMESPVTIEEWENVLRAFKEKKGATAPFTIDANGGMFTKYHFNNAFGVGLSAYVDNGVYKLPQLEPGYKDFLTLMNKWYEEGLLDKEFDTNNAAVVDAKMTNGSSGVTYGYIGGTIGRYVSAMKDKEPNYKIAPVDFPVAVRGDEPRFTECQKEATSPFAAITANCKNPEIAVEWLDYFYSPEGEVLKNFGVEGVTYNKDGEHYVYTDEILNNPNGLSIAEAMAINFRANVPSPGFNQHEDYLKQYYQLDEQLEALDVWTKYTKNAAETIVPPITTTSEENEKLISIRADVDTYTREMVIKFIKGSESLDNYDKFVDQLKKMGIEEIVKINQAALDRYNSR